MVTMLCAGECGLVAQLLDYAQYHISFEELFFQVKKARGAPEG